MRVVTGLLAAGFAFALSMSAALAGNFDGKWTAEIPPQAKPCNGTSVLSLVVANGQIIGQVHTPWGNGSFNGTVGDDGNGAVSFGRDNGTVHFSPDRFEMNWTNARCGARDALGDRAPSEEQVKVIAEQRRQYQATFDELVARANGGDKSVDYAALRAAYPYTEFWDPYGGKTEGLMQEAQAAQKGGDCTAALEKLDTVIKYDFTIDAAHALRSDCLKAAGDRRKADIESDIADGLIHSLMNSGDGSDEKSAYVIVTMREEMDALANRHIQFKTRQTEVRGSNGHYYDRVQGISIRKGLEPGSIMTEQTTIAARTVYFDVGAFVAGRQSRNAAVSQAAATIH